MKTMLKRLADGMNMTVKLEFAPKQVNQFYIELNRFVGKCKQN